MTVRGDGPDELLTMLKAELRTEEQQLFLQGFQLYLNHDARKDFVIDLDDVYSWLGFTRKDNAKRVVVRELQSGMHYKTVTSAFPPIGGGQSRPPEITLLTVHGFKQLCMQAGTDKARRVRDYYLTMEEVLFEYTKRQAQRIQRGKLGHRVVT